MKKLNYKILKEIRNNCMIENKASTPLELNFYYHIDFTDDVEMNIDDTLAMSICNLFEVDKNGEIIDDKLDKELILYHNKGVLPYNLNTNELSEFQFNHSWIIHNSRYYDAECLEGVDTLFELPYFNRYFRLFNKFANDNNITNINANTIKDFNTWATNLTSNMNDINAFWEKYSY